MNIRVSPRPAWMRRLPLLLALQAAVTGNAWADTTTWITRGPGPYWDVLENWLNGPPQSTTTDAVLSGFDSELRSGSYTAATVVGTGTLTISGGTLRLAQPSGSSIGNLVLGGGALHGPGGLVAQSLDWRGGDLGEFAFSGGRATTLRVAGAAQLSGNGRLGYSSELNLQGSSVWKTGASHIQALGPATLRIGSAATLSDQAGSGGDHRIGDLFFALDNQGTYVKTGAAKTTIELDDLHNTGSFQVRGGRVELYSMSPARQLGSTGSIVVDGGALVLQTYRFTTVTLGGSVSVDNGELQVTTPKVTSDAHWDIGDGGKVSLNSTAFYNDASEGDLSAATITNDGVLRLAYGSFELPGSMDGDGVLQLAGGARLSFDGATSFDGSLEMIPGDYPYLGGLSFDLDLAADPFGLRLGGTAKLGGSLGLKLTGTHVGRYRLLSAAGGVTGRFDDTDGLIYGDTFVDIDFGTPNPVPEPSTVGLVMLGLAGVAMARRRAC